MIIYRPHRRELDEAMAEAKEFNNEIEMKEYIVQEWNKVWEGTNVKLPLFTVDDIVIDNSSEVNDERNGWEDTKYVCTKRMGDEDYIEKHGTPQCIGMCATRYKK